MAKAKHYMFSLLFTTLKARGQEQNFFLSTMHGTPSTKLGSSKHGPCKLFGY
jgi:hypothetical protein